MEWHGSTDADQRLIISKGGESLVVQYICRVNHSDPPHHQTLWALFSSHEFVGTFGYILMRWHSIYLASGEMKRAQRKICKEIITQREWSWRWGLQADTHNHMDKCSQRKCADAVVVPAMVEGSSRVKQMQSLWPEWMWHPLKCGFVLSLLPPSINFSLHCLLLLLPFFSALLLTLSSVSLSFVFGSTLLFNVFQLFSPLSFSLWSQSKSSAGTPQSVTLPVWPDFAPGYNPWTRRPSL